MYCYMSTAWASHRKRFVYQKRESQCDSLLLRARQVLLAGALHSICAGVLAGHFLDRHVQDEQNRSILDCRSHALHYVSIIWIGKHDSESCPTDDAGERGDDTDLAETA